MRSCALLLVASLCAASFGCAACSQKRVTADPMSEHLLFNRQWIGASAYDASRSDWPSTPAFADGGEEIEYRETIIDRQGGFGSSRDRLYRRFDSIRQGYRQRD